MDPILVVEDDAGTALLVKDRLADAGWESVTASTGKAAIAWLATHRSPLILLDNSLPDMTGEELVEMEGQKLPPFIITTGAGSERLAVTLMKLGARDYLVKDSAFLQSLQPAVMRVLKELEMEKKLADAEEALRRNEARHRAMVANIADVIAIVDQNGINRYKSPNIENLFGWRPEELVGEPASDTIHPEDLNTNQEFLGGLLSDLKASGTSEWRYRCKDGTYKWIECTARNLLSDPDIRGILLNFHDISERKRAEEARKRGEAEKAKLETQLQQAQKMESVGRLAGGVAHDFNNMLGVILGHAELALDRIAPSHPIYADLEEIHKAADRSADLTRQLLAFARKQTVAPKVLDLNETLAGMLKMLKRLIGEDIELRWQPDADLWPVRADPSQIDQILANLCVNARDGIAGVGTISIKTGHDSFDERYCETHAGFVPGDYVRISVTDDGCGMNKETLSHLFEPFFTTKAMGKGTGLGLATVYGIVKQNSGFINVESEPNQGTTFTIYLARHVGKDDPTHSQTTCPVKRGEEIILLVEDEDAILKLTKRMLEGQGYTVLAAGSPGEGMRMAESYPGAIHLLMTDVIMPEMNGRDLAKNLLAVYPNIKRLFMSGYTADVIAHHGVLDDGMHFIQKPFSMRDLSSKVREVLDHDGQAG